MFGIFNRSGKTPVEKDAITCWLTFSIFVGMLFGPSALFAFICFMIELTGPLFADYKRNELVTEFSRLYL